MSPSRLFKLLQRSQRSVHGGRWLTLALGSVLATGAGAAPLPAGVDRYVLVAAPATECSATDSAAPVICAASTEALMAYATTGKWGETITASAAFGVDNFQVHLKGTTHIDAAEPIMDLVQFDSLTVTGPTPTVRIGVHAHIVGTGAPSAPTYASGAWSFAIGARNPASSPGLSRFGDWIVNPGQVLLDHGQMWSTITGGGAGTRPAVDDTVTGSMTVNTGQAFELGSELTMLTLNLNVNFSQVQWWYDVPAGYQLTTSRGLVVGTVPEPGAAMMLAAGLAGLGLMTRRRARRR